LHVSDRDLDANLRSRLSPLYMNRFVSLALRASSALTCLATLSLFAVNAHPAAADAVPSAPEVAPAAPTAPGPLDAAQLEQMVLDLVNQARADHSVPPLALDPQMSDVARGHSFDMMASG